jgi:hypothetical protein
MTGSERCFTAIMAAANKENSQDRLRIAIQRAIERFQSEATKIADLSARRGAVIDLLGLVEASRHDKHSPSIDRNQVQVMALDFAEPLVRDLVAWSDCISTSERKAQDVG